MNISPASLAAAGLNQAPNDASVAVMRKALDITQQQGADLVALINQTNGVGQNLNVQA
ncbi:MAG TPA: putative motility protein [Holophagaceae bacterium]